MCPVCFYKKLFDFKKLNCQIALTLQGIFAILIYSFSTCFVPEFDGPQPYTVCGFYYFKRKC